MHVEKVEMHVYCDIKSERGPKCCVQIPALPFQEKNIIIIIHYVYFFKVRADDRFCSKS